MTDYNDVKKNPVKPATEKEEKVEEHTKLKPVTTAKKRKKGLLERFVVAMIGPEGIPSVTSYLNKEIVVPAIKDVIANSVSAGVNMMVYGRDQAGERRGGYRNYNSYQSPTYNRPTRNYQSSYNAQRQAPIEREPVRRSNMFRSTDYIMNSRQEALEVLDMLRENLDNYGLVTLADFFDLIGVESQYVDNNYGWQDLTNVTIVPVRGGYTLSLPNVDVLG